MKERLANKRVTIAAEEAAAKEAPPAEPERKWRPAYMDEDGADKVDDSVWPPVDESSQQPAEDAAEESAPAPPPEEPEPVPEEEPVKEVINLITSICRPFSLLYELFYRKRRRRRRLWNQ